ncbi:MAG TPA: HAD-IA family hydrolase [Terriglobales bacterium]|nr:HAD-IA family hydrolase [Terriglobales bacterium]
MPFRTIIFDLGRTLVPFSFDPLRPRLAPCMEQAQPLLLRAETGELGPRDFQRAMCALTGVPPAEFPPWWNSIFGAAWLIPPGWIRRLLASRRVGLLSNTNALHYEFLLRERPLLRDFAFRIASHEAGAAKPDPRIYAAAEAAAQCGPHEILYLDDIPAFVEAARARGWQAEVFTGSAPLAASLEARGETDLAAALRAAPPAD